MLKENLSNSLLEILINSTNEVDFKNHSLYNHFIIQIFCKLLLFAIMKANQDIKLLIAIKRNVIKNCHDHIQIISVKMSPFHLFSAITSSSIISFL